MKLPKFPHYVRGKRGNTKVPIYLDRQGKYRLFKVPFYAPGQTKREFKTYASFKDAEAFARDLLERINLGTLDDLSLSRSEVQEYRDCKELVEKGDMRRELTECQGARKITGDVSLITLAEFYFARHQSIIGKSVKLVADEFMQSLTNQSFTRNYIYRSKRFFARLAETFQCEIGSLRAAELETFLSRPAPAARVQRLSARAFNDNRRHVHALIKFAIRKRYLHSDCSLLHEVQERREESIEPPTYTPSELRKLLLSCPIERRVLGFQDGKNVMPGSEADLLLFMCIGAFAGLRSEEMVSDKDFKLRWEHIHEDHIEIIAPNSKTRRHRDVPLWPNLKAWLAPYRKESGSVFTVKLFAIHRRFKLLTKSLNISRRYNGLRHSYESYRIAETSDIARVSLETGHTPEVSLSNYRKKVRPEMAKEWFSIVPSDASDKITYLKTA